VSDIFFHGLQKSKRGDRAGWEATLELVSEEEESVFRTPGLGWPRGDAVRQLAKIIIATGHPPNRRGTSDYGVAKCAKSG
jgi:hypothetical protein